MKLSNPSKRMFWITVLFTDARRSQLAAAEWSHIDFDVRKKGDKEPSKPKWHFPDENAKAGHGYDIPLSRFMSKLLSEWHRYVQHEYSIESQCRFVFPSAKSI
jgi:integrase